MSYSQFSLGKVKKEFSLKVVEGVRFFPDIPPIEPSPLLAEILTENIPLAAVGSEKARSELLISPVLVEVRRVLNRQISLFSGEEFAVDESLGLNGVCDFLLSKSPELLEIEAPVVAIVEAKKADLTVGLGQCIGSMVAAQLFNHQNGEPMSRIFGSVSNGTAWRFLQLQDKTVTIDLIDYPLLPVGQILAFLKWMIENTT
ncbi:MAG: hypothetical protein GDA56_11350 [Hormoscilla sp. GM7CHS1pb]|nr:hypothetical protein [Hormoscilla sp. GM7CHS1pb]